MLAVDATSTSARVIVAGIDAEVSMEATVRSKVVDVLKEGADVPVRSASGLDRGFGVRRLFKIVVLHRELCFVASFDRESGASSMSLPMAAKLAIVQLIDCRADH